MYIIMQDRIEEDNTEENESSRSSDNGNEKMKKTQFQVETGNENNSEIRFRGKSHSLPRNTLTHSKGRVAAL